MKKILLLLTIFFLPFNVFAYSDYIIPGGNTLGVEIETDGIMVIGFYKINGKYNKGKPELKNGDYIIKINNIEVSSVDDMTSVIENADDKRSIEITFKRDGKEKKTKLSLILDNGRYKTGLYVKSQIKGIGTLTYIDPNSKIYGALGHEIIESESNSIVEIKSGFIFENNITGIEKSRPGVAGSKIASFNNEKRYGSILKNTKYGIFGIYEDNLPNTEMIKVSNDIKIGPAYIKTVLNNQVVEEFYIEITSINENSNTKNITFEILDDTLIEKTGGVVQGMSGSPIIQNNNIVGVITHVIVDNPITGYGLFITKMLEEGDK